MFGSSFFFFFLKYTQSAGVFWSLECTRPCISCRRLDFCNGVLALGRYLQHKLGALKFFFVFVLPRCKILKLRWASQEPRMPL